MCERILSLEDNVTKLQILIWELKEKDKKEKVDDTSIVKDWTLEEEKKLQEYLSGDHLTNLEWALGSIALCSVDANSQQAVEASTLSLPAITHPTDKLPASRTSSQYNDTDMLFLDESFSEACRNMLTTERQSAHELVTRVSQAVTVGLEALIKVAAKGKGIAEDGASLRVATENESIFTVAVLEEAVARMGQVLGYGVFGPHY